MKTGDYIITGLVILALLLCGYVGYTLYPKINKCPQIASTTVYVHDTVWHTIQDTVPYYTVIHDSIVYRDTVFKNVDTVMILKDYYASHYYTRKFIDTSLAVMINDEISQNKFGDSHFSYKILRPQTVVTNEYNSYSYSRYLTASMNFLLKDISYTGVELSYVAPAWQGGIGYNFGLKGITLKVGGTLMRIK